MLADDRNVDSVFFVADNREKRTGGIVFFFMPKGANEGANTTAGTLLWVDNENFVR